MSEDTTINSAVYDKNTIEFVTVAAEYCSFVENANSFERADFTNTAVKLLPLLYLKASMCNLPDMLLDEEPEHFVSETDYEFLKGNIASVLQHTDGYIEVFHPDIQYSENGVAAFISEDLADVYQDLKDFISCFQLGNEELMNDALATCIQNFREFWGQKLVNALRALHNALYSETEDSLFEDEYSQNSAGKNSILGHQQNEEEDDLFKSWE